MKMRMALLEVLVIIDNLDNLDNNLDIDKDAGGGDNVYRDNDDDMTTLNVIRKMMTLSTN